MLPRSELLDRGHTERSIRRGVDDGLFVRVRRGWYVGGDIWRSLWPEGRHLLLVVAVNHDSPGSVFCGVSAAVVLGYPLYRTDVERVHVASRRAASRSAADVLRHETQLADGDVVERDGLLCTSPARTVLDASRVLSPEAGVAVADAALRGLCVDGRAYDEDRASEWRTVLGTRSAESSARGIRKARRVIQFADGRAESPGESVSRLQLRRLGFRRIALQVPVSLLGGEQWWVDFGLDEVDAFGEFDGMGKYLDPRLRRGRALDEVLLDEKRREDVIRGHTGRRFIRWGDEHIVSSEVLGRRLAEFGVHPPGR